MLEQTGLLLLDILYRLLSITYYYENYNFLLKKYGILQTYFEHMFKIRSKNETMWKKKNRPIPL